MPDDSKLPADRIMITGPQLRADRRGYLLGTEQVEGFADRLDLDSRSRRLIAGWARAFVPDELDTGQRRLLEQPPLAPAEPEQQLASAAIENAEKDMPVAIDAGLYALLEPDEIRAMREPWLKLAGDERREYPLNASELARLTGTTAKQIRSWEQSHLLPAYWIGGRRHFFSAAVVHAFALRRLDRNEIRGATRVLSTEPDDPVVALVAASVWRSRYTGAHIALSRRLALDTHRMGYAWKGDPVALPPSGLGPTRFPSEPGSFAYLDWNVLLRSKWVSPPLRLSFDPAAELSRNIVVQGAPADRRGVQLALRTVRIWRPVSGPRHGAVR